jgi:hypothetical protein
MGLDEEADVVRECAAIRLGFLLKRYAKAGIDFYADEVVLFFLLHHQLNDTSRFNDIQQSIALFNVARYTDLTVAEVAVGSETWMKYTNLLNVPEPIENAVKNDLYHPGEGTDYSVTELIDPPRKRTLEKKHDDEITVDVADEIYRLLGQAIHTILERAGVPERRFAITVLGKTVAGKIDRFKDGVLQDWKVTTVYRFKNGVAPFEVEAQLNCYAEILRQNGMKVERLEANPIFRDWSKLAVLRDPEIPRHQTIKVPVRMWTSEETRKYLADRVALHESAKLQLPDCSNEERWAKPDTYAVMKKDRERAVRVLDTRALAEEFIALQKDQSSLYIVHRPGQNVRCQSYCSAAPFCEQWKKLQEASAPTAAVVETPKPPPAFPPMIEVALTPAPFRPSGVTPLKRAAPAKARKAQKKKRAEKIQLKLVKGKKS